MRFTKPNLLPVLVIVTLLFSVPTLSRADTPTPSETLSVTGGKIQGERDGDISIFKGIPFAAPPVDDLRWKAPQPVPPWDGVKQATKFGPSPMQSALVAAALRVPLKFSEDCLYLNVWTPEIHPAHKLPVMVWIYGGAYTMGSTATPLYDGERLAQKGVIVVSVAYRLGAFGFLAHPDLTREGGKGNFGIQDQIAGLHWVHDNIAAFGGDPSNVTIFGESAGSISVSLLVMSPRTKGLFAHAIAESGAAFLPPKRSPDATGLMAPLALAENKGRDFLSDLGVNNIAEARALPASKIQAARFTPEACYDDDLLPSDPPALFQNHQFNDTPILIGFNSDDGAMFSFGRKSPEEFISSVRQTTGEYADKIISLYPHADTREATRSSKDIIRDAFFAWPAWSWATLHSKNASHPAFVYYFDPHTSHFPDGANHASEISYVFGNFRKSGLFLKPLSEDDERLSDEMMNYWVNFAKTGNPNGDNLPNWDSFAADNPKVLSLDVTPSMTPFPNTNRMQTLDALFNSRFPNPAPK